MVLILQFPQSLLFLLFPQYLNHFIINYIIMVITIILLNLFIIKLTIIINNPLENLPYMIINLNEHYLFHYNVISRDEYILSMLELFINILDIIFIL